MALGAGSPRAGSQQGQVPGEAPAWLADGPLLTGSSCAGDGGSELSGALLIGHRSQSLGPACMTRFALNDRLHWGTQHTTPRDAGQSGPPPSGWFIPVCLPGHLCKVSLTGLGKPSRGSEPSPPDSRGRLPLPRTRSRQGHGTRFPGRVSETVPPRVRCSCCMGEVCFKALQLLTKISPVF